MGSHHRVLVTGARGFIGRHIVERAKLKGCEVIATFRGAKAAEVGQLDVSDIRSVDRAFNEIRPTIVINCASYGVNYADQDAEQAIQINIHGALHVLWAADRYGVRQFLHLGSCFEYGSQSGRISEESTLNPTAIYGATKAAATLVIRERARALDLPCTVVRPFGTWGPGEPAHRLVPQIIDACIRRRDLDLTPCEAVRDYTYVEDMADRIVSLALARNLPEHAIINVGSGEGIVLRDFACAVARCLGGESLLHFGKLTPRPTEMASLVADIQLLEKILGKLTAVPLSEGVIKMVGQYQ